MTHIKSNRYGGNECGDCETIHCMEVKNLKETLYFYEGILG